MSGGVDSAVAAALLVEQGHEVVGLTMKLHGHLDTGTVTAERGCCDLRAYSDARRVCDRLGIPHQVVDLSAEFRRDVMDVFASEYFAGRTPNPCVLCNTRLKWEHLWQRAAQVEAEAIATGHYARVEREGAAWVLRRAASRDKDQSYALWGIQRERLARTLFPLGGLEKAQVRDLARGLGLSVADKAESQDICFVPDGDHVRFLRHHDPVAAAAAGGGEVVGPDGAVLGRHDGVAAYTVGQRRGLGLALGRPHYVSRIDAATGRVHLAKEQDLYQSMLTADGLNWLVQEPGGELSCQAAIRYRDPGSPCLVRVREGVAEVRFARPRRAIAPGQCVVFYQGDQVLGGGWIRSARDSA
jgi:tRNA-specific 2-thiouridylase